MSSWLNILIRLYSFWLNQEEREIRIGGSYMLDGKHKDESFWKLFRSLEKYLKRPTEKNYIEVERCLIICEIREPRLLVRDLREKKKTSWLLFLSLIDDEVFLRKFKEISPLTGNLVLKVMGSGHADVLTGWEDLLVAISEKFNTSIPPLATFCVSISFSDLVVIVDKQ